MINASMKLSQLLAHYPEGIYQGPENSDPLICGLSLDSRKVQSGDLFICISGTQQDGHLFAAQAVESGAVALLVEHFLPDFPAIPQFVVHDSRKAAAILAAAFYGYPSRKMKVIGVTGTNGKTTTTYLLEYILQAAGYKAGVIGTIEYRYAGIQLPALNTTPSALELNELMAKMVEAGCSHVIMEVSSHSLVQERVDGIDMDYAIFTNLTRDHLDYHKTEENYLAAKAMLFKKLNDDFDKGFPKYSIVNRDDTHSDEIIKASAVPVLTYGIDKEAQVKADSIQSSITGLHYIVKIPAGAFSIDMKLSGLFNVYNSLAAIATAIAMDIPMEKIQQGLAAVNAVPGRFEKIDEGQDFLVVVDYAHTDDALRNLLEAARPITQGNIILVFGAGGDRDRGKRPLMGDIAARMADYIIITSDNPRSEDPAIIALDIEIGVQRIRSRKDYEIILDRGTAIQTAIKNARKGDTVLFAGKGHETYEVFADRTIHFSDADTARQCLKELLGT